MAKFKVGDDVLYEGRLDKIIAADEVKDEYILEKTEMVAAAEELQALPEPVKKALDTPQVSIPPSPDEQCCVLGEILEAKFKQFMELRIATAKLQVDGKSVPPLMVMHAAPPTVDLTNAFFNLMAIAVVDFLKGEYKQMLGTKYEALLEIPKKEETPNG